MLTFPLIYFVLMAPTRHYFVRYMVPVVPFLAIFAGFAILQLSSRVKRTNPRLAGFIMLILLILAIVQPLLASLRHDYLLTKTDTRTITARWIKTNLEAGYRIAQDWPVHGVHLNTPIEEIPDSNRLVEMNYMGGTGLSDRPLDWYRQKNFDYLVTTSYINQLDLNDPAANTARKDFYNSLDNELMTVFKISPVNQPGRLEFEFDEMYGPFTNLWHRTQPGPALTIYKVN
jgi:hypothetical protein